MAVNLITNHFRFGSDGGTESTHHFLAAEDTNISLRTEIPFLLRFNVQETGGSAAANVDNTFEYRKNSGSWTAVTTTSSNVKAVAVTAFADAANCTQRLSGSGTFETSGSGCTEDGVSGGNVNDIAASGCSETECGLQIVAADVSDGDTLEFRLTSPDFTITNNVTPTITVLKSNNNFSGDSNCKALYKFESGALTTDSKSTETLTDVNTVGTSTSIKVEGAASADFIRANAEYLYRNDADLSTGFPLKSDDTTKNVTFCAWVNLEIIPAAGENAVIVRKYGGGTDNKRSFSLHVDSSGYAAIWLGYNSGGTGETKTHGTVLSLGAWYFISASYQNSDKAYAIRIRNIAGEVVGSDLTGTATLDVNKLSVSDTPFTIGAGKASGSQTDYWDGKIDECVVFNDILTSDEVTLISKGEYSEGVTASVVPILMKHYRARRE